MGKSGHVPTRMCTGCGCRFAKDSFVRFTVQEKGEERRLVLDSDGKAPGRGAYVCRKSDCLEKALKRRTLTGRLGATSVEPTLTDSFVRLISGRDN